MIAWSNTKLKFTSGIGTASTAALLSEVTSRTMPVWLAMVIAALPLVVFAFVQPDVLPRAIVLPCQVFGALWYLAFSAVILEQLSRMTKQPEGGFLFLIGLAVGSYPCVVVLWSLFSRRQERE